METYYLIIIPRLSGLLIRNSNRLANSATEEWQRPREEKRYWSGYWARSGNPNSGRSARVLWETVHFFFLEIWDRRKDFMFSVRFLAFLCCSGLVLTRRMTLSRSDSFFINKSHSNPIFIEVYFSFIHPSIQEWPAKIHKECRTRHRIPQQEARGKLILDRLLLYQFWWWKNLKDFVAQKPQTANSKSLTNKDRTAQCFNPKVLYDVYPCHIFQRIINLHLGAWMNLLGLFGAWKR